MSDEQRVVVVVQSRMGSNRLPGKSLRILAGRPMIDHVLGRAAAIPHVDDVVLATSMSDLDDRLVDHVALNHAVSVWRGPEWDVLERVTHAALFKRADVVIRITGDCPLLDPAIAGAVLELFRTSPVDYASNDTTCSGYPDGTDVEVMTFGVLDWASARATDRCDREHVTPFIRKHARCTTLMADHSYPGIKLSVDVMDDFARVQEICRYLPTGDTSLAATLMAAWSAPNGLLQGEHL